MGQPPPSPPPGEPYQGQPGQPPPEHPPPPPSQPESPYQRGYGAAPVPDPGGPPPAEPPPGSPPPAGPPPAGPPPYEAGTPGAAPAPGRQSGGRTLGIVLAVVGAVLVLGLGGVGIAYFAGVFSASPEQVVEDFVQALNEGDCARMTELVTEANREATEEDRPEVLAECESGEALEFLDGVSYTLDDTEVVSESGDEAVVEATITTVFRGESQVDTATFTLHREGRNWRIHDVE